MVDWRIVTQREPYAWAAGITVAWLVVVLLIVVAAGDDDPAVEAGTIVMLLPVAGFTANLLAGARGRDRQWATRFAVATGVGLALAYLVQLVVRAELDAVYLVPMIAFVTSAVLWLCSAAGWLIGGVVRHGLGIGGVQDEDEGFL